MSDDLRRDETVTLEVTQARVAGIDGSKIHRPTGEYTAGEGVALLLEGVDAETVRRGLFLRVRR
jgi:selenocysteine-specific translation elongation factor